jgi:hypothetical protein
MASSAVVCWSDLCAVLDIDLQETAAVQNDELGVEVFDLRSGKSWCSGKIYLSSLVDNIGAKTTLTTDLVDEENKKVGMMKVTLTLFNFYERHFMPGSTSLVIYRNRKCLYVNTINSKIFYLLNFQKANDEVVTSAKVRTKPDGEVERLKTM